MNFTKGDINRLGIRLREDKETSEDLKLLNEFRNSYDTPFKNVIQHLRKIIDKEPTCTLNDRQTKTEKSIKDKLKRLPKTQLSQMQDIRGCRIVTEEGLEKIATIKSKILTFYPNAKVKDRNNIVGYRALHIIVKEKNKAIEIQLRTELQDLWANFCEKYSNKDNNLKYGTSSQQIKNDLIKLSDYICECENLEKEIQQKIKKTPKYQLSKYKKLLKQKRQIKEIKTSIKSLLL